MAEFLQRLWDSVFTPGPTPTLMVATNVTFAALQLILLLLLFTTGSIHFIILSTLTAGLWWAINWFAGELREAQKKEDEAARIREARQRLKGDGRAGMGSSDDTDTETELDQSREDPRIRATGRNMTSGDSDNGEQGPSTLPRTSGGAGRAATGAQIRPERAQTDVFKKRRSLGEAGELSTDSEWEKVDEER